MNDLTRMKVHELLSLYQNRPLQFCKSFLNMHLIWDGQKKIFKSILKYPITVVPSGHSTGKSASAAALTVWWLTTRFKARVIVLAPSYRQLSTVFYAEVSKWYNKSLLKTFDLFLLKNNIMQFNHSEYKKEWYMLPISPKTPDQLQGQHGDKSLQVEEIMKQLGIEVIDDDVTMKQVIEMLKEKKAESEDNLLVIVDESSGVQDDYIEVLEGTDPTRMVFFGNMTKTSGFFYNMAYRKKSKEVNVITLSSEDSPFMSKEQTQSIINRYGKDSNVYRVRIQGLPPTSEEDTCIPLSVLENAVNNEELTKWENIEVMGLDPARYGGDDTVGYVSTGSRVELEFCYNNSNSLRCIEYISEWCRRTPEKTHYLLMDSTGLGGPIADAIYEKIDMDNDNRNDENYIPIVPNLEVIEINFGSNDVFEEKEYANIVTEMFFFLKEELIQNKNVIIPDDMELIEDLSSRKYLFKSDGRLIIESKDEVKKRIKRSPGRGDSFLLAVYGRKFV